MATQDEQRKGSLCQDMPLAIIGYGVRFPGDATSPEAFYRMLSEGRDAWTETPPSRYNVDAFWHPSTDRIGTTSARGAHYLTQDPSVFDAPFFSMTGAEAGALDPALRMMLEVVYECLEDSGVPMESVVGSDTSVFFGTSSQDYKDLMMSDVENVPLYSAVGVGACMLANRISHFYDLRGTSQTVDTACSATMVALHQACNSLRTGESRMTLMAGSQLMFGADGNVALTRIGFLSPDGRCYTFDERANGYSRGEGVGCVAIKRLDDALADGDTIRAVIRATGSNQDGKTPGIVQPNPKAQRDLIRQVYKAANLNPDDTQYFEAHGTGTTLGDPLEVNALVEALSTRNRSDENPMYIGSVKTNVGHLEGSAGLAGLLKSILQLEHGQIFPSLNYKKTNPRLRLDDWKLKITQKTIPWPTTGQRRISINSFGYGGTNAHCILDDAYNYLKERGLQGMTSTIKSPPGLQRQRSNDSGFDSEGSDDQMSLTKQPPPKLFVFSSPEQAAVERVTTQYAEYLQREAKTFASGAIDLRDLAYTLGLRRSVFQWRLAVVAQTAEELQTALAKEVKSTRAGQVPELLWVFTGQGAQYAAMGRELLQFQVYEESVQAARTFFRDNLHVDWDVLEELAKPEKESRINNAEFSQPLCTVLQVALVDLLTSWKLAPGAVVGHSSGEIGAAYAAGFLSAEDAWTVAYHRGKLSASITTVAPELEGAMGMMAVGLSAEDVKDKIPGPDAADPVVVACYNSPQNVTLSGNRAALVTLEEKLKAENIFARQLRVDIAYHSPYMKVIADEYLQAIADIKPIEDSKSSVTMLSTVTGQQIQAANLGGEYWVDNMCSPVRFVDGISAAFPHQKTSTRRKKKDGLSLDGILEVGPHSALQGPLRQILTQQKKEADVFYNSVLMRGKDAAITSLETAGALWSKGVPLDLAQANSTQTEAPRGKTLSGLPSYAWNHTNSFWFEHKHATGRFREGVRHDLIGARVDPNLGIRWRNWLRPKENPWLDDFKIGSDRVLSSQTLLVTIVEAGRQMAAETSAACHGFTLSDVKFGPSPVVPDLGMDMYTDLRPGAADEETGFISSYDFEIFTDADDGPPLVRASGKLYLHYEQDAPLYSTSRPTAEGDAEKSPEDFYKALAKNHVHWGAQNQLLSSIRTSTNSSAVEIHLKDTKKAMPLEYEYAHLVHPTTLNACFQGVYAAFDEDLCWRDTRSLESVYISNSFPQGEGVTLTADSNVTYKGFGASSGEVTVQDPSGNVMIAARGLNMQKSKDDMLKKVAAEKPPADVKKVVSNFFWKPDVQKLTPEQFVTIFKDEDLVLSSTERPCFPGTGSLCHNQLSAIPDVVPWKAFTAKWLELTGHKVPTQVIVEVAGNADDFTMKALDTLGGKFGATPVCQTYLCALPEPLPEVEGSTRFQDWTHFFEAKYLDLQKEKNDTDLDAGTVNTFIISDHIMSLADADVLLENAANSLKPGGFLVMSRVEGVHSDQQMEAATKQLQGHGLSGVKFDLPCGGPLNSNTRFLVSQKPWAPTLDAEKVVFVVPEQASADLKDFIAMLKKAFVTLNVEVQMASWDEVGVDGSIINKAAVVNFLEAEDPVVHDLSEKQYEQVRSFVLGSSKGGLWLHRGNCYVDATADPRFHSVNGLLRVVRNEKDTKFHELGLSYKEPLARESAVEHVLSCFRDVFEAESLDVTAETEVSELNGVLYIPRIMDEPIKNRKMQMIGKQPPAQLVELGQQDRPLRLTIDNPNDLESLKFVDDVIGEDLGDYQILVDVQAHGVRSARHIFDRLCLNESNMGTTAAGTVKSIGSKVTKFDAGDRVAFFAPGAYRTRIVIDDDAVFKIPAKISTTTAATFASDLLIAYYALFEVCRLRPQDKILITSAETGLGDMLVQLSLHLKAQVFILAGYEDSRCKAIEKYNLQPERVLTTNSPALAKNISEATNRTGLDFVFNVSPGAASDIAIKAVSRVGRAFACSSKTSTDTLDELELQLAKDANLVRHLTEDAGDLLEKGIISPLAPRRVYSASDMKLAFEDAASQKDRNPDVALELGASDVVPVVPIEAHPVKCRSDGTYVLVGGLGGVGRWLSFRLAERGAKYIATVSRSGAKKPVAQQTIKELAELGVECKAYCCDIGDSDKFHKTVEQINKEMPPIKGAVHGAMDLRDNYLCDTPYEDWAGVSVPKIQGGLNMTRYLPKDMDFLIFVSSLSPIVGQAMQANYSAGNAFLDGFAFHLRDQGWNASVVNFGLIAGIGHVAELGTFSENDPDYEKYSIPPHEVWSILESAMTGYMDEGYPTGVQQLTCCMSGGLVQTMTTLQTFAHIQDPKFNFIQHLDALQGPSVDKITGNRKAITKALGAAESLNAAVDTVETAMVDKIASAIPMPPEDVDPSKPVTTYGVDSLIANEVRNWSAHVVKGQLLAPEILAATSINDLATKLTNRSDLVPDELKE